MSLPNTEQSIFEEEFKYLIVTSSLFNETNFQQQQSEQLQESSPHDNSIKKEQKSRDFSTQQLTMTIVVMSVLNLILAIGVFIKSNHSLVLFSPYLLSTCLFFVYSVTCYFLYRHHRHMQIRKIHASALESMHEIISMSRESDAILHQLINTIQSDTDKKKLNTCLSLHFDHYTKFVQQLQPLIDRHNLSRLREMYNIKEGLPSSLLSELNDDAKYQPNMLRNGDNNFELISSVVVWKRREYLLYLLALDVMTTNSNKAQNCYGKNWKQAIQINRDLVKEYRQFNQTLSVFIPEQSLSPIKNKKSNLNHRNFSTLPSDEGTLISIPNERALALTHRIAAVEKHLEDIQAKVFLLKQDTKFLTSGRISSSNAERMNKRFQLIDNSIDNLSIQWEESKMALNGLLEDKQLKGKSTLKLADTVDFLLPSPPSSPRDTIHNYYQHQQGNSSQQVPIFSSFNESSSLSTVQDYPITNSSRSSFTDSRLHRIRSLKLSNSNNKSKTVIKRKSSQPGVMTSSPADI
ncbi:MAG: hypothetical protein EXX96DRAFT_549898 [Benjaminiella poitrasii]|nr:MAG: hypothetical protein EXX96DRAFT_549898 [Benjaminiella poitrasii]